MTQATHTDASMSRTDDSLTVNKTLFPFLPKGRE